jgi:hypothetical protein
MSPDTTTNKKASAESKGWNDVVLAVLRQQDGPVHLSVLYSAVRRAAPELVAGNPDWTNDKIRQVVQRLAARGLAVHPKIGYWGAAQG